MAQRETPKVPTPIRQNGEKLVLLGDVRQAPVEVSDGDSAYRPVVVLWVRADDGAVVGHMLDEPGHPAESLVQALQRRPAEGQRLTPALPSQVVLFDEELAKQVKPLLAPMRIQVTVSPPFKPLDDLFADLFAHLTRPHLAWPLPDAPGDVLGPLLSAAERLWHGKPWQVAADYPPFALVAAQGDVRTLFASILGANGEVFGVALYTSLEDYEATAMLGESPVWPMSKAESPAALEAAAAEVLEVMRHPVFLVSFEPSDEATPAYRDHLARCGWPRRLSKVPTFAKLGGGKAPGPLTAPDASEVTLAVGALVTFCERHGKQISAEEFPIRDSVEANATGKTVRVDVSVPGEDPSAPPATVYRFRVSLTGPEDVWRTIDVRSDQTLEDLHYEIQDAFGWDDDHLYAFFMNGKAWSESSAYVRPEGQEPGQRNSLVRLDRLGLRPRKRFLYIFDFGDQWRHEIRVEKAGLTPDEGDYPRTVEEHGAAPPQYGVATEDE